MLVVTLTGGERGDILNPAMDRPGIKERMSEVRREEMAKAAEALGVKQTWLGFVDSGAARGATRCRRCRRARSRPSRSRRPRRHSSASSASSVRT